MLETPLFLAATPPFQGYGENASGREKSGFRAATYACGIGGYFYR
jgi:hypothetical protein